MTQEIVVSRRDGILRAPDGTKHRVARGRTLAHADHPAVLANPGDWVPMIITLTVGDRPDGVPQDSPAAAEIDQLNAQVTELEETLAGRDAELTRLAEGVAELGVALPAEDDREPGWLVDLVLDEIVSAHATNFGAYGKGRDDEAASADIVEQLAPPIAPSKPRKRTVPPLTTRTGDDG